MNSTAYKNQLGVSAEDQIARAAGTYIDIAGQAREGGSESAFSSLQARMCVSGGRVSIQRKRAHSEGRGDNHAGPE